MATVRGQPAAGGMAGGRRTRARRFLVKPHLERRSPTIVFTSISDRRTLCPLHRNRPAR